MGVQELLILLAVLMLLFGATRIPKLARAMGEAKNQFKTGLGPQKTTEKGPCPFCNADIPSGSKFCPGCARSAEDIIAEKSKREVATSATQ